MHSFTLKVTSNIQSTRIIVTVMSSFFFIISCLITKVNFYLLVNSEDDKHWLIVRKTQTLVDSVEVTNIG